MVPLELFETSSISLASPHLMECLLPSWLSMTTTRGHSSTASCLTSSPSFPLHVKSSTAEELLQEDSFLFFFPGSSTLIRHKESPSTELSCVWKKNFAVV